MASDPNQHESKELPPDVKKLVEEFLESPEMKADMKLALVKAKRFLSRYKEVGILLALAEEDDRTFRVSMAKALQQASVAARETSR